MTSPAFTQITFRLRNDDGNETDATWRAAENTNATINVDENFRLRFCIDETASRAWTNVNWTLQYQKNGAGGYAAVSDTTPVKIVASANYADGADCTDQLSGGTGTFLVDNNGMKEANSAAVNSGSAGNLFETEWCLQLDSAQMANGDYVDIRVANGSGYAMTYTNTPRATASKIAVSVTDSVGVADTPAVDKLAIDVSVTESIQVTDTPTVEFPPEPAREINVSETVNLADNPTLEFRHEASAAESIGVTDTPTLYFEYSLSVSDSIGVIDAPTIGELALDISVTDSIGVADAPTVEVEGLVSPREVSANESITVQDLPAIVAGLSIAAGDAITVSDAATISIGSLNISTSDLIAVGDTPSIVLVSAGALGISIIETIEVADAISVTNSWLPVSVSDSILVQDTAALAEADLALAVTEAITVTESIQLYVYSFVALFELTLPARSFELSLENRDVELSLRSRDFELTLEDKV